MLSFSASLLFHSVQFSSLCGQFSVQLQPLACFVLKIFRLNCIATNLWRSIVLEQQLVETCFYEEMALNFQTLTKNVIVQSATNLVLEHMDMPRQDEHNSPPSNSYHLKEIWQAKTTKIAKITYQSLIEVVKHFQRHWSSAISGKEEKVGILGKFVKM